MFAQYQGVTSQGEAFKKIHIRQRLSFFFRKYMVKYGCNDLKGEQQWQNNLQPTKTQQQFFCPGFFTYAFLVGFKGIGKKVQNIIHGNKSIFSL